MAKDKPRPFGAVRKLPSGKFQARYWGPDGIRRSAPHTFATEKQGLKWLTLKEAEVLRGEWTAPEAGEILLGPYAEKWMSERKLAPRTLEVYESIYRLNIKPYLAHLAIGAIKPDTIRTWRSRLLSDGRPELQAVKAYRILRAVFTTAVKEDELIRVNPCRIKGFDKERSPERHAPTVRQVQALAEEMPARFYALILLAAYSGLRWGELTALRRADLNLKAATVRVHRKLITVRGKAEFGPPKSEAGKRTVNLPESAVAVMRHHLEYNMDGEDSDELLFKGTKGAPLQSSNFRRAVVWDDAIRAAGLPVGFHFHDLRHLGNLLAAETGASTKELMHRLGQSTVNAAMIYQHATSKRDREIAARIDERLIESVEDDEDDDGQTGALVPAR